MNTSASDSAQKLLSSIGMPEDFLDKLLRESDWSFVIKLHALFEAVLAGLITRKLSTPALGEAITHLDFNNAKAGKVAFAKGLGLVGPTEAAFLRALSELRNLLVHDVRNVTFDLKAYLRGLDANQRKSFRQKFGYAALRLNDGEAVFQRLSRDSPNLLLYLAAYSCLLALEFNMSNARITVLIEALRKRRKD